MTRQQAVCVLHINDDDDDVRPKSTYAVLIVHMHNEFRPFINIYSSLQHL